MCIWCPTVYYYPMSSQDNLQTEAKCDGKQQKLAVELGMWQAPKKYVITVKVIG